MRKTDKIKNLLLENKTILLNGETNNGICFDGIVDEDTFNSTKIKLCVLLKETNGLDENGKLPEKLDDWDYMKWIREQQADGIPEEGKNTDPFYGSTYRKLCLWISEFFDVSEENNHNINYYFDNDSINKDKVRQSLKKTAIVNLKKSWGTSKTNSSKLWKYTENEEIRKILIEQINIIGPDIVLCCSPDVYNIASVVLGNKAKSIHKQSQVEINRKNYFFISNNIVYINFYHPSWYGKTDILLAKLIKEAFEQALEIRESLI